MENQKELSKGENKEIEKMLSSLENKISKATTAIDEIIEIVKMKEETDDLKTSDNPNATEIVNNKVKNSLNTDFNPYEERDELADEAKEIYDQLLSAVEIPLKIPHKVYNRAANLLITDAFLNKILVSEDEFIKIYKEAFDNN